MLEEELRAAAAEGNLEVVVSLLRKGAKLSQDSSGRTPLHLAAATGNAELIKSLATAKTVNIGDSVGRTAIQIAATGGHVNVVQELLLQGAEPNIRDKLHGNSPLHEASWHGFSQTIALLLKFKANPDVQNCAGFYPLHLACQAGHNQSCRELLLAGANPDVQNNYGDTSLHTSARYGHAGVARILISASCRVSDQNKNGDTALHIAAAMGRRKLTTILLEAGCDKSIRNKQYETACDIATRKDLNEIISILQNVKPQKAKKKSKKTSETSDSDKKSREVQVHPPHDPAACGSAVRWSPYGCHYYPDPNAFPQPRLDSLPGEPLGKGEQYYLDLAGNIRKGPVGVGLTCYCANFLRDMETRLEKNNAELKHKIRATKHELQERVERTEELLNEWVRQSKRKHRRRRSQSVDLLQDTPRHEENESRSSRKSTPALPSPPCSEDVAKIEAGLKSLQMTLSECAKDSTDVQEESYPAEIETMPYRSRTAVYSPTCFHLSDAEKSIGKPSRIASSLEQLNFDRRAV